MKSSTIQNTESVTTVKTLPLKEAFSTLKLPGLDRNLFSSPQWMSVIDDTYNLKLYVKYIENKGEVVSYIVYSVVTNFLELKICICSYCDYCDCYVHSAEQWDAYFKQLRKEYSGYRMAVRNLRDQHALAYEGFEELSREYHHEIDLSENLDTLWKNLFPTFRQTVETAQRRGVTVRHGEKKDLNDFYRLHLSMRKNKYKVFPQPKRFFDIIWDHYMPDNGALIGAYDERGKMIGASINLICGDTLFYKFSTSDPSALKLRPNNLLMWESIKYAKEKGLTKYDLGSSGFEQKGLVWYKTHICANTTQSEIKHIGFAPEGYKFSQKRILRAYTKLFTMPWMPDGLVAWGSNFIYPFLA